MNEPAYICFSLFCIIGEEWFPDEINYGYLEWYFLLLGCLMILNFIIFVFVAKRYKYVEEYKTLERTKKTLPPGRKKYDEGTPLLSESGM